VHEGANGMGMDERIGRRFMKAASVSAEAVPKDLSVIADFTGRGL